MLHGTIRNDGFWRNTALQMLEQCCNHSKQCRNNVVTLCCAKHRRCESSQSCNITLKELCHGWIIHFSEIQLLDYYQCCVLIG